MKPVRDQHSSSVGYEFLYAIFPAILEIPANRNAAENAYRNSFQNAFVIIARAPMESVRGGTAQKGRRGTGIQGKLGKIAVVGSCARIERILLFGL